MIAVDERRVIGTPAVATGECIRDFRLKEIFLVRPTSAKAKTDALVRFGSSISSPE